MHVFVVSPVYPPEPVISSRTSAQIADTMFEAGHKVTVITAFPNRPAGKLYPGFSRRLCQRHREANGPEIVRCFATLSPKSRMFSRFLENISFGLTSGWAVLTARRPPDVIYANTWAIFAMGIMAAVARLRHIPFVMSVQDIYPDSLVSQQRIRADHWLACLMRWVDRCIAQSSAGVIVISESFAEVYLRDRGIATQCLHVIPNWADAQSIVPNDPEASSIRARHGIPMGSLVMAYGGNIGMAAGVETLIESFRILHDVKGLQLMIAGAGSNLATCQNLAESADLPEIKFHSPWLAEETSAVLSAADVLILPTRGRQSFASVPSKLIGYMLASRPVIALAWPESDLARTIELAGCGWIVEPDQPILLANKIREVVQLSAAELTQRGQAGRDYALRNFTGEVCLPKIIHVLEQVAARHGD